MLSASCKYGIRAVSYLALHQDKETAYVPIGTISRELGISFHFLTKILQTLTQEGILESHRGPSGGVALARPSREITVLEVIRSIDGPGVFSDCILGLPRCNERHPCPLHGRWARERRRLAEMFGALTLARLARASGLRGPREPRPS